MSGQKKHRRLNASEWAEAEAYWESGSVTLTELSERYGITTRALQLHFEKHDIKKGVRADQIATAVRAEVFSKTIGDTASLGELAVETRQTSFDNAKQIEALVMGQLAIAQKSPELAFKAVTAIKTLALAAQTLERVHAIKWSALGLDRQSVIGSDIPEIVIRDLSAEEIQDLQSKQDDDDIEEEVLDCHDDAEGDEDNEIVTTG